MTAWISLLLCALCGTAATQDDSTRVPVAPSPESPAAQDVVADARTPRTLAIYDLADLKAPPGMDMRYEEESPDGSRFRERIEADRVALLEKSIRNYVRPKFARGLDELQVHQQTVFVVTATAEQHAWIRRFLELQRAADAPFLMLESQHISGSAEQIEQLGFLGPTQILADASEAQRALAKLEDPQRELVRVSAPRMVISPGTPCEISLIDQVSYVKSYEVVYVHPGPVAIADPVIDVISEGIRSKFSGVQIEPGLYALDVEVERTEIERPIPTKEVQVAVEVTTPVTISQPTVLTSKLSSTVLLRDGAGVWFRVPDGDQELLIMVRMQLMPKPARSTDTILERPDCPVEHDGDIEESIEVEPPPPGEQRARRVPD